MLLDAIAVAGVPTAGAPAPAFVPVLEMSLLQGGGPDGGPPAPPGCEGAEADAIVSRSDATVCRSCCTVPVRPVARPVPVLPDAAEAPAGVLVAPVRTDTRDWTSVRSCDARRLPSCEEGVEAVDDAADVPLFWPVAREAVADPLPQPPLNAISAMDMPSDSAPDVPAPEAAAPAAVVPAAPEDAAVPIVKANPPFWPDGELGGA